MDIPDREKGYLIDGDIASLSAAVLLIRDAAFAAQTFKSWKNSKWPAAHSTAWVIR